MSEWFERLLREAGLEVRFGLRAQRRMETVTRMRAEGKSWDEIGQAIGWAGSAVERHYELEKDRSRFQFYCAEHDYGWSVTSDGEDHGCVHCQELENEKERDRP